jgi:hypothetical protein
MASLLDRVVAVATIKLELTRVQFVAERNRLFGLMANINDVRVDCGKQASRQVSTHCCSDQDEQNRKFVNPSRKMKLLHSNHPEQDNYRALKLAEFD